ncbi:acyltransferase 3 [Rhodovulum sp. PH10]|uniref:acyltransferase family protein n=1 Tax=Rhodovulum sp. PH10 TaxID=1187851 RepID=UPI00027C1EF4|nr:acyltransferase [Rhodovulum sp. PH10]EJW09709.1 acyltransferase 3 [Rhodovulum sp. PH10]
MKTIQSLQVLRGVAATAVAYAHAMDMALANGNPWQARIGHLDNLGAIGVDLFFVISGVIITLTARSIVDRRSAHVFAARRFLRVAPFYWIVSLVFILPWLADGRSVEFGRLVATVAFYPCLGGTWHDPVLDIGWTLCFEMLFYAGVYLAGFLRFSSLAMRAGAVVAVMALAHLAGAEAIRGFLLSPMLLEFGLGIVIARLYLRGSVDARTARTLLLLGGVGLSMNIAFGYGDVHLMARVVDGSLAAQRVLLWGVPSAALVAGALLLERATGARPPKSLVRVGDASYAIYLTHPLLFPAVERVVASGIFPADAVVLLATSVAVGGGLLSYLTIERPLVEVGRRLVDSAFGIAPRLEAGRPA